jgi:pilus assembly protein Flp/PilA
MNGLMVWTWLRARLRSNERGASMVEYVLLVALIALAVIGAVVFFGGELNSSFSDAGTSLSNLPN